MLVGSKKFVCNTCQGKSATGAQLKKQEAAETGNAKTKNEEKKNETTNNNNNKNEKTVSDSQKSSAAPAAAPVVKTETATAERRNYTDAELLRIANEHHKTNKVPAHNPPGYAGAHARFPPVAAPAVAKARVKNNENAVDAVIEKECVADFHKLNLGTAPTIVKTPEELEKAKNAFLDNCAEPDFQGRSATAPGTAIYRGDLLDTLVINKDVAKEVKNARHAGTFQNHFRVLRWSKDILANSPKEWKNLPLTLVLIRILTVLSVSRKWKPQTLFRTACSMQGAFSGLTLYTNQKFAITLGDDAMWRHAMAIWRLASQQNQPHGQTVVTAESILEAIEATDPLDLRTKAALILQWFLAARAGDVLKLRKSDINFNKNSEFVAATFNHAKTVAKRGAYTVKTKIDLELLKVLMEYMETLPKGKPDDAVFPLTGTNALSISKQEERMRASLKHNDAALTTRSIRRGALQAMALQGVDADTLMHFSGHKNLDTLKRYLDWGRLFAKETQAAHDAAKHLSTTTLKEEAQ
jgi:integrase